MVSQRRRDELRLGVVDLRLDREDYSNRYPPSSFQPERRRQLRPGGAEEERKRAGRETVRQVQRQDQQGQAMRHGQRDQKVTDAKDRWTSPSTPLAPTIRSRTSPGAAPPRRVRDLSAEPAERADTDALATIWTLIGARGVGCARAAAGRGVSWKSASSSSRLSAGPPRPPARSRARLASMLFPDENQAPGRRAS